MWTRSAVSLQSCNWFGGKRWTGFVTNSSFTPFTDSRTQGSCVIHSQFDRKSFKLPPTGQVMWEAWIGNWIVFCNLTFRIWFSVGPWRTSRLWSCTGPQTVARLTALAEKTGHNQAWTSRGVSGTDRLYLCRYHADLQCHGCLETWKYLLKISVLYIQNFLVPNVFYTPVFRQDPPREGPGG